MCSYLKKCKQKVVINNSASTTQTMIAGVPQGSIDPLLFNLLINDLVLFIKYTALGNYTDGNNLSITGTNIENINYYSETLRQ